MIKTVFVSSLALAGLLWMGLQIQPTSFASPSASSSESRTVPLPTDLPAPVMRFYQTVYGDSVPLIQTVILTGRARIRPVQFGPSLPARFTFIHEAGQAYRHYIEATFLGIPFLKVNEGYLGGESFFESPMGSYYDDPHTNQGANLALWAEAGWFPALWITDPRVHWQAVDATTALLYVPFEEQEESLVVRFDPDTGLITTMEAMRYREAGEKGKKILWITSNVGPDCLVGSKLSAGGAATWLDQGKPWATFTVERVVYNVEVSGLLRQKGP